MLIMLALIAHISPSEADQRLSRMTALYEQICLKAFPDDRAIEALMAARNARELSAEDVKVTMRGDPARGWDLHDGATLWIEFPPFHACSIRWNTTQIGDLHAYRAVAEAYENGLGGFKPMRPFDADRDDIHIHAVGEQRMQNGTAVSLFVFDQHIVDPKRRAAGETGVELRFVHQFAPLPPGGVK